MIFTCVDHLHSDVLPEIPTGPHTAVHGICARGTDTFYADFWLLEGSAALISVLKRQLYIACLLNTWKLKLSADLQK